MRYLLAPVILRLLGSRVVHEDCSQYLNTVLASSSRDAESLMETCTSATFLCGESLFDCLLLVLHVLLSSYQPSWLKTKSESKSTDKDFAAFDRDVAESLQVRLFSNSILKKKRENQYYYRFKVPLGRSLFSRTC